MGDVELLDTPAHYRLHFDALSPDRRHVAIPCDARGQVHMDRLDERTRCNYFFARALIGHHFARPRVLAHEDTARPDGPSRK